MLGVRHRGPEREILLGGPETARGHPRTDAIDRADAAAGTDHDLVGEIDAMEERRDLVVARDRIASAHGPPEIQLRLPSDASDAHQSLSCFSSPSRSPLRAT